LCVKPSLKSTINASAVFVKPKQQTQTSTKIVILAFLIFLSSRKIVNISRRTKKGTATCGTSYIVANRGPARPARNTQAASVLPKGKRGLTFFYILSF
jgi:hypothetical protein